MLQQQLHVQQLPWHRRRVGALWEEIGRLQFDFSCPRACNRRISCSTSVADPCAAALEHELDGEVRASKRPTTAVMEDFGFERLGQTFDFALAQSVFTHITLNSILRCLENVRRVLEPGGKFYATFLENPDIHNLEPVRHGGIRTHPDRDPYHYPADAFGALTDMHTEHIGDWGHPRGASMLCFTNPD